MRVINSASQRVPIHSWAQYIDPLSLRCLRQLAQSERLAAPIAVMPDVHCAGNIPVGTVLLTADCVLPAAIGEDLGCGMCSQAYPLDARDFQRGDLENLLVKIMEVVPSGKRTHRTPRPLPQELCSLELRTHALEHAKHWLAPRHLGTLGSGNHFIELQRDPVGQIWVTVHSGSRGIGAAIASHHATIAATSQGHPLSHFELDSILASDFFNDLAWALRFAAVNRKVMLDEVTEILAAFTGMALAPTGYFDVTHNLITVERHQDRELVVHRKGAMPAPLESRGIIPGSMGTASYIVDGLGCAASYNSSSHGAGRKLSRSEAHKQISIRDLRRHMSDIVYPNLPHIERTLVEESPCAYKEIKEVLSEESDLVRPVLRLEPMLVVKGS